VAAEERSAAALYRFAGERFWPGPLTAGPWSPDAQHGGPVSALLAGALEDPEQRCTLVRVTVELLRPVPLAPLRLESATVRAGRNVQWVEASLWAGDTEVARARGVRIRRAPVEVPVDRTPPPAPPPPGEGNPPMAPGTARTAFAEAVDLRFVRGGWDELGPVTMWTRLLVPVVEGRAATAMQRAAAAADFGNGVSRVVDFSTHTFINADLSVALSRVPVGDWIGFDAVSRLSPDGFGQAESQIFDAEGPVGRAVQSLLVAAR
jgi:hypothetical protein